MNWTELFGVTVSPLELIVRGTAVYWFIFLIFRLLLHRGVGAVAIADVMVLVLIADAAQNAMAGGYTTITEGVILIGTIIAWNWLFDWATSRSKFLDRLLEPPPVALVEDGQLQRRNMRHEMISEGELMSKLREHGIEHLEDVKRAVLESSGEVSVIRYQGTETQKPRRHAQPG
jgi:uncharacterized membrane protein YcaP (DUF421 family)